MCALCRSAAPTLRASSRALRQSPRQVRTLYTNKPHVAHENFPFSYANKKSFTLKYVGSATTFFLIPFIAVGYQLNAPVLMQGVDVRLRSPRRKSAGAA